MKNKKPYSSYKAGQIEQTLQEIKDSQIQASAQEQSSILADETAEKLVQQTKLKEEFEGKGIEAAALGALDGLTLGLSSQGLVKSGLVDKEYLRNIKNFNLPEYYAGDIGTTIGAAILSGGTSLAAKGATKAGTILRAVEKAGGFAEKGAEQLLKKAIKESGNKTLAKKLVERNIPKLAGSAVEGSAYGIGNIIAEDAVGNAEFNAENVLTTAGLSAAFGAAGSGLLQAGSALKPIIKNNKVVDFARSKMPEKNVTELVQDVLGYTKSKRVKQAIKKNPYDDFFFGNVENTLKKAYEQGDTLSKLKDLGSDSTFLKTIQDYNQTQASRITKALKSLDDEGIVIKSNELVLQAIPRVKEYVDSKFFVNGVFDQQLKKEYNAFMKSFEDWKGTINKKKTLKPSEIQVLKQSAQKKVKKWASSDEEQAAKAFNRLIAQETRNSLTSIAARTRNLDVKNDLIDSLKEYGVSKRFADEFAEKVAKDEADTSFLNLRDSLKGLLVASIDPTTAGGLLIAKKLKESSILKKVRLLTDLERSAQKVSSKINKSVKNFTSGVKSPAKVARQKSLANFAASIVKNEDKPKNDKEALKLLQLKLPEITSDLESITNHRMKQEGRTGSIAPMTMQSVDQKAEIGMQYILSKLPQRGSGSISPIVQRPYEPSDSEVAKFKRIVETVENPLTALEDLESQTLTRDQVDALKAVYPDIYSRIQQQVIEQLASTKKQPTYAQRIYIGMLLDVPTDASLQPQFIKSIQRKFAEEQAEQSNQSIDTVQGAVNTTVGGLKKLSFADDAMSGTEKVTRRE